MKGCSQNGIIAKIVSFVLVGQKYKTFEISCGKCGAYVLSYHKYGQGKGILRLYLEHISAPPEMAQLYQDFTGELKKLRHLQCKACEEVLGVAAASKSGKPVYRMRQGIFHRKLMK